MTADPTVFVIDDDDAVRDSLLVLLESAGFAVEGFASPAAFLDSDALDRPGCLVTDVRMPGMSGLDLQETLARRGDAKPVIVITGHADVPLAVRAMKSGAVDFIEKPFDEDTLIAGVRTALARAAAAEAPPPAGPVPAAPACPPEVLDRFASLTPREHDVLRGMVAGKSNKIIAYDLSISPRTVEIHRARVMEKMQAESLPQLVRMSLSAGIAPEEG
ncbi:response regulator FixJ [Azospirillum sp. ST 5-10]|uniref:response regulator FixJ n=1 Tax=unclassified Azospirillum TaxID=2630922 RepID=UPI003F4A8004